MLGTGKNTFPLAARYHFLQGFTYVFGFLVKRLWWINDVVQGLLVYTFIIMDLGLVAERL